MNKEKGNIDFDQIVRERFTNDLMAPPSEMWQEIDNSLTSEADSELDNAIGKRFQENTLSPSFLLRQKVLIKASLQKFANYNYLVPIVIGVSMALLITTTLTYYDLNESETTPQAQEVIQTSNNKGIDKNPSEEPTKQMQSTVDISSKINKLNKITSDQKWLNAFNNKTNDNKNTNPIRINKLNDPITKESRYLEKENQFSLFNNSSEKEKTHLDKNLKSNPITNYPNQSDEVITESDSTTKNHNKANTLSKSALNPELISESLIKGQKKNNNVVIIEKADSIKKELNSLLVDHTNSLENTSESNQKSNTKTIADTLGRTNKKVRVEIIEKDSLPIKNIQRQLKTENAAIDSTKIDSKNDLIVLAEKKSSPFSITALISLIYVDRFLKTDNEAIKDFYNQHQKGVWQLSGELIGNYQLNKKWGISLGLSMVNYQQDISLQNIRPEESQTIKMDALNQSITVTSSLNEVTMSNLSGFEFGKRFIGRGTPNDLSKDENLYSFNFREEQVFNLLQLPLSIQYYMGEGKTKFIVSAGLLTSYLIKDKSKIEISTDVNPNQKATIENYHSARKVSFGLTTRAGIIYSYSPNISFLFTPTFNYSISNLNQSNSNKINPFDLRISLGLNYHF